MESARLILASTSPYRNELLGRLRVPFEAMAPRFDEATPLPGTVTPDTVRALALDNARGKALSLRADLPGTCVLASDQLGECEGKVLNKPGTMDAARDQLRFLSGREHRLHTAVALLHTSTGRLEAEVVTTVLRMRALPEARIDRYLEQEMPLDCAGSYRMESLGIFLFEYIRGDDPTAVIGLPLMAVCRLLEDFGFEPLG